MSVFYDLGSGTGKGQVAAYLSCGSLEKVIGIEILESLYKASLEMKDIFTSTTASSSKQTGCTFEVTHGDIMDCPWQDDSDICLVNCTCFSEPLMQQVYEKSRDMKKHSFLICIS